MRTKVRIKTTQPGVSAGRAGSSHSAHYQEYSVFGISGVGRVILPCPPLNLPLGHSRRETRSMKQTTIQTKDEHLSELVKGACLAFTNAVDLFREARTLYDSKAFSRALFLHQISMEECGKTEMIGWWATGHLMGTPVDLSKVRSRLTRHKTKNYVNAYMLPLSEAEQKTRDESDWQREHEAFKEQQSEFHNQSNDRKNDSLYVDIVDDCFLGPADRITEDMVHEIAEKNHTFIELMRPKVEMLRSWEQDPDGVRNQMHGLKEKMETLKEKMPDDPRGALETLLGDMINEGKKTQQSNSGDSLKAATDS